MPPHLDKYTVHSIRPYVSTYICTYICDSVCTLSFIASEVKQFSASEMTKCDVALNNAIRKIFTYQRWEGICILRESFGYPDLYSIFTKQRANFLTSNLTIDN
jgi:hypothetical protein